MGSNLSKTIEILSKAYLDAFSKSNAKCKIQKNICGVKLGNIIPMNSNNITVENINRFVVNSQIAINLIIDTLTDLYMKLPKQEKRILLPDVFNKSYADVRNKIKNILNLNYKPSDAYIFKMTVGDLKLDNLKDITIYNINTGHYKSNFAIRFSYKFVYRLHQVSKKKDSYQDNIGLFILLLCCCLCILLIILLIIIFMSKKKKKSIVYVPSECPEAPEAKCPYNYPGYKSNKASTIYPYMTNTF